jgi:hypothetical protein
MHIEKPPEELDNVRVERNVSRWRLEELGGSKMVSVEDRRIKFPCDLQVEEGEVTVVPEGSQKYMWFEFTTRYDFCNIQVLFVKISS